MKSKLDRIEAEILALPAEEREFLLERILISFANDPETEKRWAEETKQRLAELQADPSKVVDFDEAIMQLRTGCK